MRIMFFAIVFMLFFLSCQNEKKKTDGQSVIHLKPLHADLPFDSLDTDSGKLYDILSSHTTGLDFSNDIRMSYEIENWTYPYLFIGAGLAVGDINQDGLPDAFFSGNLVDDKLFLNKGNLRFEDISLSSGISENNAWSTGATMVDINNDGYLDIYVCRSWYPDDPDKRKNLFYINNGDLTFTEKATDIGLADTTNSIHASFFDYDLDGDLDVYVVGHPIDWNDRRKYNNHEKIEQGINASDRLYRNNGNLQFEDVSLEAGINNHGYGLSVTTGDINQDGWQDILVTNDWGMPEHLYLNEGNGRFKDKAKDNFTKYSFSAMGSDIADFNNDGFYDIAIGEMHFKDNRQHKSFIHSRLPLSDLRTMERSGYHSQYYRNTLQLNNGDATFSEIALAADVASTDWSWSMLFMDADNDGWQDLFVSNGNYRTANLDERPRIQKIRDAARRQDKEMYNKLVESFDTVFLKSPNTIFKNNGDLTFKKMNVEWGTNYPTISHGAAYADFDGDGDLDILTNNTNEDAMLYRNNSERLFPQNHFLRIQFTGPPNNRSGIGTEVTLTIGEKLQRQFLANTKGYEACSEFVLHFGLGKDSLVDQLEIKWPDGKRQVLKNVKADLKLLVDYKDARKIDLAESSKSVMLFSAQNDVVISFDHRENDFDDFYRNRLLPKMYSRGGPAIAVGDINGDGLDDCYIGGASGFAGGLFLQSKDQKFIAQQSDALEENKAHEDMGALFFDADQDGDIDLYVVSGGSEFPQGDSLLQDRLYLNDGKGLFTKSKGRLPETYENGSVVSAADFDGDGDLDLFVGAQLKAGSYPQPPSSMLLQNNNGHFEDVTDMLAPELKNIGMVNAALWTDIDNDLKIDLIVVGEWMSIGVFKNMGKSFNYLSDELGLGESNGWWNSISAADFDSDGDLDYVLGNQGTNMFNTPEENAPLELFYDDFDQDQDIDLLYSYYYHGKRYPVTYLDDLAEEMKFIGEKFKSYTFYGMSTTEEVLGKKKFRKAKKLEANTFSTVYLENIDGRQFKQYPLPQAAQVSVVYGILCDDFDGDGNEDILLQGNFSEFQPQYEKQDGMTGLLLKGNGLGDFEPVPSVKSGFWNRGEGRALVRLNDTPGKSMTFSANNNGPVIAHTYTTKNNWLIELEPDEYAALITFKDKKKQRVEFYYGEGYLSQNGRKFYLNAGEIEEIELYNYKGEKRDLKIEN